MDEIDRALLTALSADARLSMASLAEQLHLTRLQVSRRVQALEERGAIRGYHADIDPRALGLRVSAVMLVRATQGRFDELYDVVASLDHVTAAVALAGEYDLAIIVRGPDMDHLREVVLNDLAANPAAERVQTLIVMDELVSPPHRLTPQPGT